LSDTSPMEVGGRTALVTGATGGLGAATARHLAERGAHVIVTARRTDLLEQLAQELSGDAIPCDLADRQAVRDLAEAASEVDIVVSNAALPAAGSLTDFTEEEIDRALDVNLRTSIVLARLLAPGMIERRSGHLVFISSLGGKMLSVGLPLYAATKFGLRGFSLSLRHELAPHGVGVSTVFPGVVIDAGLYAESGLPAPKGIRASTSIDVARGVVRAIEDDVAEVDVASTELRVFAALSLRWPDLFSRLSRRSGGDEQAAVMAEVHRSKR
jgi:short-subunit dehydrogenase